MCRLITGRRQLLHGNADLHNWVLRSRTCWHGGYSCTECPFRFNWPKTNAADFLYWYKPARHLDRTIPNMWAYITLWALWGAIGKLQGVINATTTDFLDLVGPGFVGSPKDDAFHQHAFSIVRTLAKCSSRSNSSEITLDLKMLYAHLLFLQTAGNLMGILVAEVVYSYTGSLTFSIACSGLVCLPMVPVIAFLMPESVPLYRRQSVSYKAAAEIPSELISLSYEVSNSPRLLGLMVTFFISMVHFTSRTTILTFWGF